MVEHMVWMKFKAGVGDERVQEHMKQLASLKGRVPGIVASSCGENITDRANGFTHGLIVTLESKSALEGYATHPEHVAVAEPLFADAEVVVMDFEH